MPDYAGNTVATARNIGTLAATTQTFSDDVGSTDTNDYYRFTTTGTSNLRLNLTGMSADADVLVYAANGTTVMGGGSAGGSANETININNLAAGTYYVRVYPYSGSTNYNLSLAALPADDYAANTSTTGQVAVGGSSTGVINSSGDQDWFRVSLVAGQQVVVNMEGSPTSHGTLADTYIRGIYNSSGGLLANTSDDDSGTNGNSRVTYTASSSGTYYIAAGAYSSHTGSYRLSVNAVDDYAANTSTTGQVAVGGSTTGSIGIANDQDWFRTTLTAGTTYTIRLAGSPSGAASGLTLSDPYLRGIYSATGSLIANTSNDDFGSSLESQVTFTPTTTGTYYLAAGAYGASTGTYRINLTQQVSADIAGSAATTATLAVNSRQSSRINVSGDQDWFRASLTAGVTYVIEQMSDQTSANPLADPYFRGIYASNGTTLLAGTSNDDYGTTLNSRVQFTAPTTGTYFLAAGAYSSNLGNYVISLATRNNITDAIADTTQTTGNLTVGTTGIAGTIDYARDVDWYRVTLAANQSYAINVRGSQSGAGTLIDPDFVGVYNSAGNIIAGTGSSDSAGSPEVLTTFRPTTAGTYYLAVSGGNDTSGTYRLSIETNSSTDVPENITTTASVAVGGTFSSAIETVGDVDWIRVSLTQGTTYEIQQLGAPTSNGTLGDPLIAGVYNSAGQVVPNTANDDFGGSYNSRVNFTAPGTGNFYIAASAYGNNTGTYQIRVTAAAADTTAPTLNALSPTDNSTGVSVGSNLTFSFSEAVRAGTGNILLSGGGQSLSIPVTSSQVSFSGEQMTVNPSANLNPGVQYTVTMAPGVVKDIAGNNFAGITNTSQFNFTTASGASTADSWTVLVYVAADNNLERFAISDLNEMESVTLPANVNVVTLVDRIGGYDSSNGDWTNTRQGAIVHDTNTGTVTSFNTFQQLGELNTGSGQTLTNFINWGTSNYAADNYALVVWDHGGGLSGTSWDDTNNNDNLTATELTAAISNANVNHFDVIGFDACLQGMVEQAWDLRNFTDVVVASEELIPGDGWAYDRFLGQLAANPTMTAEDLGRSIVTTYGQEYAGQDDITLSAVRTSSLSALNTSLNRYVTDALSSSTTAADWTAMRTAASRSTLFPSEGGFDYRDLADFMNRVSNTVSSTTLRNDAASVATAVNNAVFASSGTVAAANGLSIYLPSGSTPVASTYTEANHSFLAASQWEGYLAVV